MVLSSPSYIREHAITGADASVVFVRHFLLPVEYLKSRHRTIFHSVSVALLFSSQRTSTQGKAAKGEGQLSYATLRLICTPFANNSEKQSDFMSPACDPESNVDGADEEAPPSRITSGDSRENNDNVVGRDDAADAKKPQTSGGLSNPAHPTQPNLTPGFLANLRTSPATKNPKATLQVSRKGYRSAVVLT